MRFIAYISSSNSMQVAMVFDEVDLDRVLAVGHYGVVVKLASACVQCPERQRQFCSETFSALHCAAEPNKCLPLLLALERYGQHYGHGKEGSKVTPTLASMLLIVRPGQMVASEPRKVVRSIGPRLGTPKCFLLVPV